MAEPKPGDFAVGSVESRAAMRLQLAKEKKLDAPYLGFISHLPRPWRGEGPEPPDWNTAPRLDEWSKRSLTLYVPAGMSIEEARKITGAPACTVEMTFDDRY